MDNPIFEPMQTSVAYEWVTCPSCGNVYQSGKSHVCSYSYVWAATAKDSSSPALDRIATALERIADALERK